VLYITMLGPEGLLPEGRGGGWGRWLASEMAAQGAAQGVLAGFKSAG